VTRCRKPLSLPVVRFTLIIPNKLIIEGDRSKPIATMELQTPAELNNAPVDRPPHPQSNHSFSEIISKKIRPDSILSTRSANTIMVRSEWIIPVSIPSYELLLLISS